MTWFTNPQVYIALTTLTILEIVLGVDNIVFLTILSGKLPPDQQEKGRKTGLLLAVIPRIVLLLVIGLIMRLNTPLFYTPFPETEKELGTGNMGITGQNLVFIVGGLYLIYNSVKEIHHKLEGANNEEESKPGTASFAAIMLQIMGINVVFSLDSVITAVGMVTPAQVGGYNIAISVMIGAVVLSTLVMLLFARPVGLYVEKHPTVKVLALSFLILIGVNLLGEGFHQHIPKGYTYFAMAFAIGVEMINLRVRKHQYRASA